MMTRKEKELAVLDIIDFHLEVLENASRSVHKDEGLERLLREFINIWEGFA
jgi:hypothetical protein